MGWCLFFFLDMSICVPESAPLIKKGCFYSTPSLHALYETALFSLRLRGSPPRTAPYATGHAALPEESPLSHWLGRAAPPSASDWLRSSRFRGDTDAGAGGFGFPSQLGSRVAHARGALRGERWAR